MSHFNIPVVFVILIVFCTLIVHNSSQRQISYKGYSLIRITPITQHHLQYLLNLTSVPGNGLDFWLQTSAVNHSADVMVEPSAAKRLSRNLKEIKMPFKILIPDIGKVIADDLAAKVDVPEEYQYFSAYQCIDEIDGFVRDMALLNPEIMTLIDIGTSFEGRPLEIIRISANPTDIKPAIWIQGGAHAREQIGPAVVLFIIQKLTTKFHECNYVNSLVNAFDWYFLPVLNPDGYNYCQTKDRLWRKTRSRDPKIKHCIGVDPNRNWDIHWNATGSSPKPCSHTYAGSKPFSEPETRAVSDFMKNHLNNRIDLFLDFHSYSQRWLTPWGYTSKLPPTYEEQKRLAEIGTEAVKRVNGSMYSVGSSGNIMYRVSGGARDWISAIMGAKYSYVVELRDKGQYGFLLPKCQILPTAQETWQGTKAMALELLRFYQSELLYGSE